MREKQKILEDSYYATARDDFLKLFLLLKLKTYATTKVRGVMICRVAGDVTTSFRKSGCTREALQRAVFTVLDEFFSVLS
jgi:hypothetical protein